MKYILIFLAMTQTMMAISGTLDAVPVVSYLTAGFMFYAAIRISNSES